VQGGGSVAIGYQAGRAIQGNYAIAIGANAGLTNQPANSIVLNASGASLNGATQTAFYVAPIRNTAVIPPTTAALYYNTSTNEIVGNNTSPIFSIQSAYQYFRTFSGGAGNPAINNTWAGTEIYWNSVVTGGGRSEFLNYCQNGTGGFSFYGTSTGAGNSVAFTGLFAGSYNTVSDYRIKTNVEPLDMSIVSNKDLRPIKYYNTQSKKIEFGFLAHEVQEHYPSIVEGEKDGEHLQTLNYSAIIPILTAQIQDLQKTVKQLSTEVDTLKQKLTDAGL